MTPTTESQVTPINLEIETWDIDRPKDYPKNGRKWSKEAIAKVAQSLKVYGWRQSLVVDSEEVIVIGHLRRTAAKSIGMTTCPVHIARDLTPEQIRGLRLADNRLAREAEYDTSVLSKELADLASGGFSMSLTGFELPELESLMAGKGFPEKKGNKSVGVRTTAQNEPVIHYDIVFGNEEEQQAWFSFLKKLRTMQPSMTISERICWFVKNHPPAES